MDGIEILVAHSERATVRVGDVFVKIDSEPERLEHEAAAMAVVPVPTAEVLWCTPQAIALGALPGTALGRLGEPSVATPEAWTATGAAIRALHDAPLPVRPGRDVDVLGEHLARECAWLLDQEVLPADVVHRNRRLAETALRPWTPVFVHGDLQVDHVFVDGDVVTGILDWSEAARGDALWDLATLTLGHPERLDDVLAGYGRDVDRDLVRAWWSLRCLSNIRWLSEHGYGDIDGFPETAVLRRA